MSASFALTPANAWNMPVPSMVGSIDGYIQAVSRFPILTPEEELRYARNYRQKEDLQSAGRLVLSHLRLVVSVARGYLQKVGLKGFENHYPKQLSGGMQQRTALARALANQPRMLLMDEPFGALDHQTRELMQELLLGIWEAERTTVLFVTHDIDESIFMGSRVVVMSARPGRIKLDHVVALPHPRHYSVKTTAVFTELKAELTEAVRVEVLAAQASMASS